MACQRRRCGCNSHMNLPPLRMLFFEDLAVGMTDYGIFARTSTSMQKLAGRWRHT